MDGGAKDLGLKRAMIRGKAQGLTIEELTTKDMFGVALDRELLVR